MHQFQVLYLVASV